MKVIDPTYVPPPTESNFTTFPDGEVKLKGFEWFSKSNNRPCLKPQKDGSMVGRARWYLTDGKQGPPQSMTLSQMGLLRRVLQLPPKAPPTEAQAGAVAEYMTELENASKNVVVEGTVKKGWLSVIKGMYVPTGYYRFFLSKVSPIIQGENDPYFICEFTVMAGEGGSATPYKGATFISFYTYAVEVVEGKPRWKLTEVGQKPNAPATRMSHLMRLTAPNWAANDIQPSDPYNILEEWQEEALSQQLLLKGSIIQETDDLFPKFSQQTLEPAYDLETQSVTASTVVNKQPATEQVVEQATKQPETVREVLIGVLNKLAGEPAVVADQLTPAGKKLAKKYFLPLKESKQIVNIAFISLTDQELYRILEHINGEHRLEFSHELEAATYLLVKPVQDSSPEEEEDEENPFS